MYGKFFKSAFTGSMFGAGADVFAVWAYVIANTVESQVELNPALLAASIGMPKDRVEKAIAYLCAPDPNSRSKAEDGRRLIREGEFAYRVPTYESYRAIKNEDDRREYNRIKKAESRARSKNVKARVNDSQPMSAHKEEDTEADTEAELNNSDAAHVSVFENADHRDAYLRIRGKARSPLAFDGALRSFNQGMGGAAFPWPVIGQALMELEANGQEFNAAYLRAFAKKINAEEQKRAELAEMLNPSDGMIF